MQPPLGVTESPAAPFLSQTYCCFHASHFFPGTIWAPSLVRLVKFFFSQDGSATPIPGPLENCDLRSAPHLKVIPVMKKASTESGLNTQPLIQAKHRRLFSWLLVNNKLKDHNSLRRRDNKSFVSWLLSVLLFYLKNLLKSVKGNV